MKAILIFLVVVVAFFLWLPTPDAPPVEFAEAQTGNGFVLRDVRLFDGEQFHERRDVVVQDGIITAVSPRTPAPEGLPEYDGSGHTLMPGLIDAHTHNFNDSRREALRFGVTTQLDMFSMVAGLSAARVQRESLDQTDQADMWSAGTLVTAPGGHGTQFGMDIPTLTTEDDAAAFVAARVAEGSDFIKIVLEDGARWGDGLPTLNRDLFTAVVEAAQAQGMLAVVHVGSRNEALIALEAGADGLVHMFGDEETDAAIVAAAQEHDAFIVATLSVIESMSGRDNGLAQDSPLVPWLNASQRDAVTRGFPGSESRREFIERAQRGIGMLHAAGVAVIAGSDAPNPGTVHGASLHRELELLVMSGMSNTAALAAATSVPATRFGLDDRGRIERGLRADLVLVAGDPSQDILATRNIVAIWKNGYRVERPQAAAADVAPALDNPVLGTFDAGDDGWTQSTDSIQGGNSTVSLSHDTGVLHVSGVVGAGAPWPWAGTVRMFRSEPMAAVNLGAVTTLTFRIRGDRAGSAQVLFFSGPDQRAIPAVVAVDYGPDWRAVTIELATVQGLDPRLARAVAVVGGPEPGDFAFELDDVVLR